MAYQTSGPVVDLPFTSASSDTRHQSAVGSPCGFTVDGKGEIYQAKVFQANGAIAAGDACVLIDAGKIDNVTSGLVTAATGVATGLYVAAAAATDGQFIWGVYVKSDDSDTTVGISSSASDVNDTVLNTTTTAGRLGDDATAGSFDVEGLQLSTDTGGSAAVNTSSRWDNPLITSVVNA